MFEHEQLKQFNSALAKSVVAVMEKWHSKYRDKDENYSASWLLTGETLHLWFGTVTLDSPQKHVIYGLVTRMLDKIIRGANLELMREKDKVGESAHETFADLGTYGFMASMGTKMEELLREMEKQTGEEPFKRRNCVPAGQHPLDAK